MLTCRRCAILSDAVREVQPGLALCPACPLTPSCGEWQHVYRGNAVVFGSWVCVQCGTTLTSEKIRSDPVSA